MFIKKKKVVDAGTSKILSLIEKLSDEIKIKCATNFDILLTHFAQLNSITSKLPQNSNGQPVPWFTYSFIHFLDNIDFSQKTIFEYGSGQSTLFWQNRVKTIHSVENNANWYDIIKNKLSSNVHLKLETDIKDYVESINHRNIFFDVIIIDGKARFNCATNSIKFLKEDGIIILDNSDWHPNCCQFLNDQGFTQIDFCGFGPVNDYTWCTSLFLRHSSELPHKNKQLIFPGANILKEFNPDDSDQLS